MSVVLIGLAGLCVGTTLGLILGALLATNKSRDQDSAYSHLSAGVRRFLRDVAGDPITPNLPNHLRLLTKTTDEADDMAGYPTWTLDGEHEPLAGQHRRSSAERGQLQSQSDESATNR
ncbi:hypothetical protein NA78x_002158 [Anatilimnocola sp. NA78]|uniref:hypothetical protein n=1 Tax=Anatilimnocola sp. NA78 TaxID=3415683 RepID=UPI003CE492C5